MVCFPSFDEVCARRVRRKLFAGLSLVFSGNSSDLVLLGVQEPNLYLERLSGA